MRLPLSGLTRSGYSCAPSTNPMTLAHLVAFVLALLTASTPQQQTGLVLPDGRGADSGAATPQQQSDRSGVHDSSPRGVVAGSRSVLAASREDYKIGASDVIDIKIEDAPELSGQFTVNAGGTILMPVLGNVAVQDKTPEELSKWIASGLQQAEYLNAPRVVVSVSQYNSRAFFIQGAVRYPGVYVIKGRASMLKLITMAGGLSENHGSAAFIIREAETPGAEDAEEKYEMIRVDISAVLLGHFHHNVPIEPGDVINIPAANVFYVAGEVIAPGSYPLKEGTTLRQAVSLARGTTFRAASNRGVIFRDDAESGKRIEMKVDISAIMSGKQEDMTIQANDIIIVPNSRLKSISSALLSAFGINAASRGMIIR